jgi:methyl-accepting chemotaxis protein
MRDLLEIMTNPEQAKIQNATRVLQVILKDEITKINNNFQSMSNTLQQQIADTEKIKKVLGEENDKILTTAEDAVKKIANMSQRIENTIDGLNNVVSSNAWSDIQTTADNFLANTEDLVNHMKETAQITTENSEKIQEHINQCIVSHQQISEQLQNSFEENTNKMNEMTNTANGLQQQLTDLSANVTGGFENVKTSASEYDETMRKNDKMLKDYLANLSEFNVKTGKEIKGYVNNLKETADLVYSASRLEESSLDRHLRKLAEMKLAFDESTATTREVTENTCSGLNDMTNNFKKEISDFANGILAKLQEVSGIANTTLENTNNSTAEFADSIKSMEIGINDALVKMIKTHKELSTQSDALIKVSADTTAQLQPLSELIEKYYKALPDLSKGSQEMSQHIKEIVDSLVEKIELMKTSIAESLVNIQESSAQLGELSGQSRQQMIDLMTDYTKAVEAMQSLNKQMMVARASAPMDAIKVAPATSYKPISAKDFSATIESVFDNLYALSKDLTCATGADIPNVVWNKFNDGDNKIFAKWLVKILNASNKKQIQDLLKKDKILNSQATQFVRSFDKLLQGAHQTDDSKNLVSTIMKSDLGTIYKHLINK